MNEIFTDKQLLKWIHAIQQGNTEVFSQLLNVFEKDITKRLNTLSLTHEDKEDIAQVIRYKIYKQVLTFDCQQDDSFVHCVNVIIKNAKIDYIRKMKSEKYKLHTESLSIDENKKEAYSLVERIYDTKAQSFEEMLLTESTLIYLMERKKLTKMEESVVKLTLQGRTKKEISKELDVPVKHIYNAQYRLKKKFNRAEFNSALFDN